MERLIPAVRAIDALNHRVAHIAAATVLLAVLVSAVNAGIRYGFNVSSNAWLELQWYMFSAMFLLGAAHTLAKNEHVRVDVIYGNVMQRTRLWIDVFGFIVFFFPVVALVLWLSIPPAIDSFRVGETSMHSGGLVRWPVRALLPLGFALLALQGASELAKRLLALGGRHEFDPTYEKPLQ